MCDNLLKYVFFITIKAKLETVSLLMHDYLHIQNTHAHTHTNRMYYSLWKLLLFLKPNIKTHTYIHDDSSSSYNI